MKNRGKPSVSDKYKIGDKVMIECMSGLGSGGESKVTAITKKYNQNTGEAFNIIWCGDHGFYEKSGHAFNTPWAYYIYKIK